MVLIVGMVKAEIYQCPSNIDLNPSKDFNREQGWELVTGDDATGGVEYDGPISATLMSGNSGYDILKPDNSDNEDFPIKDGDVYDANGDAFPLWIMCSYPHVEAAYFKKLPNKFKECFGPYKQEDLMICE